MAASLLIHTTPHTAVPPAHIDALLDAARADHIDAAEKPRPFGAPFTPETHSALEALRNDDGPDVPIDRSAGTRAGEFR